MHRIKCIGLPTIAQSEALKSNNIKKREEPLFEKQPYQANASLMANLQYTYAFKGYLKMPFTNEKMAVQTVRDETSRLDNARRANWPCRVMSSHATPSHVNRVNAVKSGQVKKNQVRPRQVNTVKSSSSEMTNGYSLNCFLFVGSEYHYPRPRTLFK